MPNKKEQLKSQIRSALFREFFNDLDFIEEINQITYDRKIYLRRQIKEKASITSPSAEV